MKRNIYWLRAILVFYIIMCLIIAGLNYGVAPKADESTKKLIEGIWHFYENGFKFIMILVASYLTYQVISNDRSYKERKKNLLSMIFAAMMLHVVLPIITGIYDLYFFSMPVPFTTIGMQMLDQTSTFYQSHHLLWGVGGVSAVLIVWFSYSLVVFIGTIFWGRRLQCSRLCLFNGFVGEAFAPAFPMIKNKFRRKYFKIPKIIFMALGVCYVIYWGYRIPNGGTAGFLEVFENMKYLIGELIMMMFLWVAMTGRGYCYYCPLGTTLGFVSKLAGQHIDTTQSHCIGCGKCNTVCPMTVDVMVKAKEKLSVRDIQCVGCGHCIDQCPTQTLKYKTKWMKD